MKKAILAIFLAVVSVCLFAQNGVIKELSGTVELKPAGAAAFAPASAGAQVRLDTVISTGFKSTALVEVGSAIITIRPLTRLTLTEISASQGTETFNVSLQAGRVRVDVNPPAGTKASLSVSSPSATASVRGTSFFFDTMNVNVREGTVAFKGNAGYTVQVGAGSFSGIGAYSIATGAQNNSNTGFVPSSPVGYNASTTGNTGGTGMVTVTSPPPAPPPVTPPVTPPGNPGGSPSEPTTGGVDIPIVYN
ncbi:MAG: FecR family protein [Treponema sp.]|jgi:hypothetical protein|nr:FecR family protein [Treponema sp.]